MCTFKIIVLKQANKKQQLYSSSIQPKAQNYFNFQFLIPPTYHTAILCFSFHICSYSNCCFLCAASQIVVLVYLLGGFRSFQRYYISFLIILYVIWFCFSKKIACGHPFHYLLIKMFWSLRTNRRRLPEKFLNLIFNFIFYVALLSLYVFPMFRRSFL